ncbi:hypothetical protein VTK73DRAFT_2665 [Phialemonium thermophilum]|uniref:Uncharacterized protein n=1 Tax=Phialemonium thermophilum TaxID=223376 RepID=A0ABR3X379_9PEZI
MSEISHFYVSSLRSYSEAGIRRVLRDIRGSGFQSVEVSWQQNVGMFKVTCPRNEESQIMRQFKIVQEEMEADALQQIAAGEPVRDFIHISNQGEGRKLTRCVGGVQKEYRVPVSMYNCNYCDVWTKLDVPTEPMAIQDVITDDWLSHLCNATETSVFLPPPGKVIFIGSAKQRGLDLMMQKLDVALAQTKIKDDCSLRVLFSLETCISGTSMVEVRYIANTSRKFLSTILLDRYDTSGDVKSYQNLADSAILRLCSVSAATGSWLSSFGLGTKALERAVETSKVQDRYQCFRQTGRAHVEKARNPDLRKWVAPNGEVAVAAPKRRWTEITAVVQKRVPEAGPTEGAAAANACRICFPEDLDDMPINELQLGAFDARSLSLSNTQPTARGPGRTPNSGGDSSLPTGERHVTLQKKNEPPVTSWSHPRAIVAPALPIRVSTRQSYESARKQLRKVSSKAENTPATSPGMLEPTSKLERSANVSILDMEIKETGLKEPLKAMPNNIPISLSMTPLTPVPTWHGEGCLGSGNNEKPLLLVRGQSLITTTGPDADESDNDNSDTDLLTRTTTSSSFSQFTLRGGAGGRDGSGKKKKSSQARGYGNQASESSSEGCGSRKGFAATGVQGPAWQDIMSNGKEGETRPSYQRYLQEMSTAVTDLVAKGPYLRGKVSLRAEFGHILLHSIDESALSFSREGTKCNGWKKEDLEKRLKECGEPTFTKIITTNGGDMEHMVSMRDPVTDQVLWQAEPQAHTFYSFACVAKLKGQEQKFLLDVDGTVEDFTYQLRATDEDRRAIWCHNLEGNWDLRWVLLHTDETALEAKFGQFGRSLLANLQVIVPEGGDEPHLRWGVHLGFGVRVKYVRTLTKWRFRSRSGQSYLHITEVLENRIMDGGHIFDGEERKNWVMQRAEPYKKGVLDKEGWPQRWYEASISSARADKILLANRDLDFGNKTAWNVSDIVKKDILESIAYPSAVMLRQMDLVGAGNRNNKLGHMKMPQPNDVGVPGTSGYKVSSGGSGHVQFW